MMQIPAEFKAKLIPQKKCFHDEQSVDNPVKTRVVCKVWGPAQNFSTFSKFLKMSLGNPLFILMMSLLLLLTPLPVASRNPITLLGISAPFKNGSKCRRGITQQTFQNIFQIQNIPNLPNNQPNSMSTKKLFSAWPVVRDNNFIVSSTYGSNPNIFS